MTADRELKAEVIIDAAPDRVWAAITDLKQMPDWSPELITMLPLKRGGLRVGQWYLGINRRKVVVWPTRNVVAVLDPERTLAWDTVSTGARWIFELAPEGEGTRLTERREVAERLTRYARWGTPILMLGPKPHVDELEDGMRRTLEGIKGSVERS